MDVAEVQVLPRSESSLTIGSSDVVIVTTDKTSKFDQLHSVRYKLEHNQLSRSKTTKSPWNTKKRMQKWIV